MQGDPANFADPTGQAHCWVGAFTSYEGYWFATVSCDSEGGTLSTRFEVPAGGIPEGGDANGLAAKLAKQAEEGVGREMDQDELANFLYSAYVEAQHMLEDNPECVEIFGTEETRKNGWAPGTVLGKLFAGNAGLGSLGYGPTLGQIALTSPTITGFAVGARINLNSGSPWVKEMTMRDRGVTILHELGHAYSLLSVRGSGGSQIQMADILPWRQDFNETLVWTKCAVVKPVKK